MEVVFKLMIDYTEDSGQSEAEAKQYGPRATADIATAKLLNIDGPGMDIAHSTL